MSRILVTGASGLLGLNLALEAAENHEVYGTVKDHPIDPPSFSVLRTDLLAPGAIERLLERTQPDWVINCAALALVDICEKRPALAAKMNTEFPGNLASHVARGGARLLHLSTDAVFDGQKGEYTEENLPNPLSVYGRTKLAGERAVAQANPHALIARVNLFGWSLSGKRSLAEFFYYNLLAGRPVMGFTDVYFCPLLVNDLAQVFIRMLAAGLSGLYHVFSPTCTSKHDFGLAIANRFGFDEGLIEPVEVERSGLQVARSPRLTMRIDRLVDDLHGPLPTWREGIERLYKQERAGYPQFLRSLAQEN